VVVLRKLQANYQKPIFR